MRERFMAIMSELHPNLPRDILESKIGLFLSGECSEAFAYPDKYSAYQLRTLKEAYRSFSEKGYLE